MELNGTIGQTAIKLVKVGGSQIAYFENINNSGAFTQNLQSNTLYAGNNIFAGTGGGDVLFCMSVFFWVRSALLPCNAKPVGEKGQENENSF